MGFPDILHDLRRKKNMTMKQLASEMELPMMVISRWEHGASQPDSDSLIKLAAVFNVSVDYLLGKSNPRPNLTLIKNEQPPK